MWFGLILVSATLGFHLFARHLAKVIFLQARKTVFD